MTYEKEMAQYRRRVNHKRGKRGRRKTDQVTPIPMFTPGMIWHLIVWLLGGMLLLSACAKEAL